jgi:RsiW-degrading membrane proteinase PrsW (M82 family)
MDALFFVLLGLSVLAAIVPMFTFLGLVWWFDRYDREPLWLVGLTFIWGAVGAVTLALVGNTALDFVIRGFFGDMTAAVVTPVVVAPLIEEPMKAVVLLLIAQSRHFDNTTDGFVYGAAAGLGFGMTENFLYFASVGASANVAAWAGTVVIRTFYSAVMHGSATSCVGAALGFARFRGFFTRIVVLPLGLVTAMCIHALWNGLLTADMASGGEGLLTVVNLLAFPLEFLMVFAIFQLCLWDERRTIHRELTEEAAAGHLPAPHVPILASFFRRGGRSWLSPRIARAAYVRTATTLAFRKHQARSTRGHKRKFYDNEVDRLRREVGQILAAGSP